MFWLLMVLVIVVIWFLDIGIDALFDGSGDDGEAAGEDADTSLL
jgi:hypothetical protein